MKAYAQIVLLIFGTAVFLTSGHLSTAQGSTYYVATNGDDNNSGSLSAPWRTIQQAMGSVSAGDTVQVRSGIYHEEISINISGTAVGGHITLHAYPGESPIIDGQNTRAKAFSLNAVNYIIIDGFEIRNFQSDANWELAAGIEIREGAQHIQIRNNKIHNIQPNPPDPNTAIANGIGIYGTDVTPVSDILVDNNELYNLTLGWSESIPINGNVDGFVITNNVIHDNDNIGIDVIGGEEWLVNDEGVPANLNQARNGLIADNLVYNIDSLTNPVYGGDRSAPCIYVDGGTAVTIERNTVHHCNFGVSIGSEHLGLVSSYVTLRNNFIYHSHTGGLVMGGADSVNGGSHYNNIINNTFFANDTDGHGGGEIWFQHETRHNIIKNNLFYATAQNIIFSNYYSTLSNNTIDTNLYYAPGGANNTTWVWNSTVYNSFAAWQVATGFDANSNFTTPQLVNTVTPDLHLLSSSPAINMGESLSIAGTTAVDGNARVQDCAIDIGADEYDYTLTAPIVSTAINTTTLTLQWPVVPGTVSYRIYHDTAPYFSAGVPDWSGKGLQYDGIGHIGNPVNNYYYLVESVNCDETETAVAPRLGEFDFPLVASDP